ncbi:MAG: hypothetical protein ACTHMC_17605 [Pseudobacter sp.]|uniref:hypothetical protein n=1 Tax=Pseudobacter sp. TaxID=2045420 RepID=UPI003F7D562C
MATSIRRKATNTLSQFMGEMAVSLDAMTSSVLGILLNIDPERSHSLSFGVGSLSLQQKVLLIRDICGMNQQVSEKLVKLVEVVEVVTRSGVTTTDQLFTESGRVGREVYSQLDSWCLESSGAGRVRDDKDARLRLTIITLIVELKDACLEVLTNEFVEDGRKASFHRYNSFFVASVLEQLKKVKLDVVGSAAAAGTEKEVSKYLDEIGKALKKKQRKKT